MLILFVSSCENIYTFFDHDSSERSHFTCFFVKRYEPVATILEKKQREIIL